jgi:hypothetical protein
MGETLPPFGARRTLTRFPALNDWMDAGKLLDGLDEW